MSCASSFGPARTRRRLSASAAAVLVGFVVLVSCSREPTAYNQSVRKDFIEGCATTPTASGSKLPRSVCGCVYDKLKKNVAFSDFKKLQDDLRAKKKPLDQLGATGQKAVRYLESCRSTSTSSS